MRPLLAIDPGLNSLGWALWERKQVKSCAPSQVGLLKGPRKLDVPERARWLGDALLDIIRHDIQFEVVSEFPAYHGSPLGWQTGDLQKLTFLVGVIAGVLQPRTFTIVTPREWKGQMPKDVVIRRLIKRFGSEATIDWKKDAWDAVGIGLWKLGRF